MGQAVAPIGIHIDQIWGQASLGQLATYTDMSESQDRGIGQDWFRLYMRAKAGDKPDGDRLLYLLARMGVGHLRLDHSSCLHMQELELGDGPVGGFGDLIAEHES